MKEFKVQDKVRLDLRFSPDMLISEINEETKQANCFWYDHKDSNRIVSQWVPLNILKHCPEPISVADVLGNL